MKFVATKIPEFDDPTRGTIYAAVDRFEAPGGLAWIIVSALPASNFLGIARRISRSPSP
jgi:hypothetical protein